MAGVYLERDHDYRSGRPIPGVDIEGPGAINAPAGSQNALLLLISRLEGD